MNEQMQQQMEEMQKAKKRFWRIMIPLFVYFGVRYVATSIMGAAMYLLHLPELIDMKAIDSMNTTDAMNYISNSMMDMLNNQERMAKLMEIILKNTTLINTIVAVVAIIVGLVFFILDRRQDKKTQIPRQTKEAAWKYPMLLLLGIAGCLGLNIIINMCDQAFLGGSTSQGLQVTYLAPIWLQIVGLGVIVPISEELFYRGVLYNRYREAGTCMRAAVYSALLFALMHGSVLEMIYAMVLGMVLAYAYEKFGSIWAPICIHMAINLTSVAATNVNLFDWALAQPMRAGIITIVCAFLSSVIVVHLQNLDGRDYSPIEEKVDNSTEKSDNSWN